MIYYTEHVSGEQNSFKENNFIYLSEITSTKNLAVKTKMSLITSN